MKPSGINHTPKPYQMQHTIPAKKVAEALAMQEVNLSNQMEVFVDFIVPRLLNEALGLDVNAPEEQTFELILEKVQQSIKSEQYDFLLKDIDETLEAKKQELGLDQNIHDGFIYGLGIKNHFKFSITGALMLDEKITTEDAEGLYKELKEKTFNWLRVMNPNTFSDFSDKDLLDLLLCAAISSSIWQIHGSNMKLTGEV